MDIFNPELTLSQVIRMLTGLANHITIRKTNCEYDFHISYVNGKLECISDNNLEVQRLTIKRGKEKQMRLKDKTNDCIIDVNMVE